MNDDEDFCLTRNLCELTRRLPQLLLGSTLALLGSVFIYFFSNRVQIVPQFCLCRWGKNEWIILKRKFAVREGKAILIDEWCLLLLQEVEFLLPRIWEPILCLYPLAKQCIPLGREVGCWRILPRVYVLITCLLCISERGGAHPSVACYSNISSDPWHDGWWMTDMWLGWKLGGIYLWWM